MSRAMEHIPRTFPLRTVLLLCSVPLMAFAIFAAWFRWQLPPLKGFYLMAYWESSRTADNPENTTQFQWLDKTAPGRKSLPVIPHDVDSNGSGLFPIELSPSAHEQGWVQLEKLPTETFGSAQLAAFLQANLYDNVGFSQVIAVPLLYLNLIPFIILYFAIWMRQGLVAEWRRLYEELHGDDFALDSRDSRNRSWIRIRPWINHQIVGAKSLLLRFKSTTYFEPHRLSSAGATPAEIGEVKPHLSTPPLVRSQRHLIFPGASALSGGNLRSKPWDESQWID